MHNLELLSVDYSRKTIIICKNDKSTLISLEKGKIPPQAVDLEEIVLGAMMIDKKGVDEVIDILLDIQ